eukprot:GHVS01024339.1.p1 GENE.GHVS01024339.1~~GHVS01024339.1.p1  ORF type:complete len:269 (+),score=117.64 GHVS01024339.1:166-972(+)
MSSGVGNSGAGNVSRTTATTTKTTSGGGGGGSTTSGAVVAPAVALALTDAYMQDTDYYYDRHLAAENHHRSVRQQQQHEPATAVGKQQQVYVQQRRYTAPLSGQQPGGATVGIGGGNAECLPAAVGDVGADGFYNYAGGSGADKQPRHNNNKDGSAEVVGDVGDGCCPAAPALLYSTGRARYNSVGSQQIRQQRRNRNDDFDEGANFMAGGGGGRDGQQQEHVNILDAEIEEKESDGVLVVEDGYSDNENKVYVQASSRQQQQQYRKQ